MTVALPGKPVLACDVPLNYGGGSPKGIYLAESPYISTACQFGNDDAGDEYVVGVNQFTKLGDLSWAQAGEVYYHPTYAPGPCEWESCW